MDDTFVWVNTAQNFVVLLRAWASEAQAPLRRILRDRGLSLGSDQMTHLRFSRKIAAHSLFQLTVGLG
jgi:hypothetical protein